MNSDRFLCELAKREEQVLNGKLLTIIFVRYESKNSEISGYIDYAHRLKTDNFKEYFKGKALPLPQPQIGKDKLRPRTSDLSYYNWKTGMCVSNDSPNFKVDANSG